MKKKLIALAVTAALAPVAAMAGTNDITISSNVSIYGRADLSVDKISGVAGERNKTSVSSNSSRFGIKGSHDIGGGMTGMFQIESGVNLAGSQVRDGNGPVDSGQVFSRARDMFIGLGGSFGTVKAGRMGGANQWVYDSNLFADQLGDTGNFTGEIAGFGGRLDGILMYETPDMSGLKGALTYIPARSLDSSTTTTVYTTPFPPAVVATDTTITTTGNSSYGAKLDYANSGFGVHLAHFNVSTTTAAVETEHKNTSVAGSYDFGNGMVTAQYVDFKVDATGAASTTQKVYNIGGKFNVSSNGAIKAQYSNADDLTGTPNSGANMIAIGYDHKLSDAMAAYVVYARTDNDSAGTFTVNRYGHGGDAGGAAAGEDPKGLSIGLSYNF